MVPTLQDAHQLLLEGSIALAEMESAGLRVNENQIQRSLAEVKQTIFQLQESMKSTDVYKEWISLYGEKFKWKAGRQLTDILFNKLRIPYPRGAERTATDQYKSDEKVLSLVSHPFVKDWLSMRKWSGFQTRMESLQREVVDGFFHPNFNLHTARTYRSSSGSDKDSDWGGSSVNIQNLYVRIPEFAAMMRKCFIPRPGRRFVENDFGALEFRIISLVWNDPEMISYNNDPSKDIHRDMATKLYMLPDGEWTKDSRYAAKNKFVFPTCYGSYYKKTARDLWDCIDELKLRTRTESVPLKKWLENQGITELGKCDPKEDTKKGTFEWHVKTVEQDFFQMFHVFKEQSDKFIKEYQSRGWFDISTGFHMEGMYSKNELLSYVIQGPGFHCLLQTLIFLSRKLKKYNFKTLLVAQVHDSSLSDAPECELQDFIELIMETVEKDLPEKWEWLRSVPLLLEAEVTPLEGSWYEKKAWEKKDRLWQEK